ncbi:peroxiredoxin [Enterovibrio nigricans]|uniref:Thiol peroxidase, atypical 2-Cys peroxiredoxin n=1 Tax=Enterovibrio nigricans DSM 22720 TaxID=1121868 RepID=A0A1T4UTT0_9GAMM|nr:peroxiredoxin [Enterovibrio nigricans]PKF50944.1 peroxiredoxin [Enterovibrio nigricans]SKA56028.1 thiol peroxidase, atypical 2-Cys peroxiredoxin [Enterovibrio nigricans DSM 22720]
MRNTIFLTTLLLSSNAVAEFSTTEATAPFGEQQVVTLEETNTFNLSGSAIKVGDYMPSAHLMTSDLKPFDTSAEDDQVKIYSVLTSVDTPVCVQQAIDLSKHIASRKADLKGIAFYAISADTPFAQQRFIKQHEMNDIVYLSDSSKHQFGLKTGSHIEELGLLTRSIIVTDKNNKIVYTQRVPELTTIPDLERAISVAQENL